jgi:hypothetical protein
MLKEILQKTWEYTNAICLATFEPTGQIWEAVGDFPSLGFGYGNILDKIAEDYLGMNKYNENQFEDVIEGIATNTYRIGYWLIAGVPHLLGKFLDYCFGFDNEYDTPFTTVFTGASEIIAVPVGLILGGIATLVGAISYPLTYVAGFFLCVAYEIAVRGAIAAVALASTLLSSAVSAAVVISATAATGALVACAIAATIVSPAVWLVTKLLDFISPKQVQVPGMIAPAGVAQPINPYAALHHHLPDFVMPAPANAAAQLPPPAYDAAIEQKAGFDMAAVLNAMEKLPPRYKALEKQEADVTNDAPPSYSPAVS